MSPTIIAPAIAPVVPPVWPPIWQRFAMSSSPPLVASGLSSGLSSPVTPSRETFGHPRIHVATCASTNDEAARLARLGAVHGTLVVADAQTAGRGRMGRSWDAAPGNLYLSMIARMPMRPADAPPITLVAGVAVAEALHSLGVGVQLKWPNDLVVQRAGEPRRKLGGILVETQIQAGRLEHVVIGLGLNVVPVPTQPTAISLMELGVTVSRDQLVDRIAAFVGPWLERFVATGLHAVAVHWQRHMCADHRVTLPSGEIGLAMGLAPDGGLRVHTDDGVAHVIRTGDV